MEGGDANTKYFHKIAFHRAKKNQINSLLVDNHLSQNSVEIRQHIVQYYKDLLGSSGLKYGHLEEQFWDSEDKLTRLEK